MITFHDTLAGDVAALAEPEGGVLALVQPLPVPLVESLLVLDLEILRVELLHAEVAHKLVLHPGLGKQTALKIYLLHVISEEQRLFAILHFPFYLLSSLCEAMLRILLQEARLHCSQAAIILRQQKTSAAWSASAAGLTIHIYRVL